MTSVKVAVRVRPFNSREKAANSVSIIRMDGQDTYITNPVCAKQEAPIQVNLSTVELINFLFLFGVGNG